MWMLTNATLAIAIENASGFVDVENPDALENQQKDLRSKQSTYFAFILWSTFGLSMIRFIGVSYLDNEEARLC